jgi:hypothetical protein
VQLLLAVVFVALMSVFVVLASDNRSTSRSCPPSSSPQPLTDPRFACSEAELGMSETSMSDILSLLLGHLQAVASIRLIAGVSASSAHTRVASSSYGAVLASIGALIPQASSVLSISCALGVANATLQGTVLMLVSPLVLAVVILATAACLDTVRRQCCRTRDQVHLNEAVEVTKEVVDDHVQSACAVRRQDAVISLLTLVLYMPVCNVALAALTVTPLCPVEQGPEDPESECTWVMAGDTSIAVESANGRVLAASAWTGLVVWGLLAPAAEVVWVGFNQHQAEVGTLLIAPYRTRVWWWFALDLLGRLLNAVGITVVGVAGAQTHLEIGRAHV